MRWGWLAVLVAYTVVACEGLRFAAARVQSGGTRRSLNDMGLLGEGEVAAVLDTGIDVAHCAFNDATRKVELDREDRAHRKVILTTSVTPSFADLSHDSHGTAMAGAAVGNCLHLGAFARNPASPHLPRLKTALYQGVAPRAKLALHAMLHPQAGLLLPPHFHTALAPLYDAGARVFIMAFCGGGRGASAELNDFAAKHPDAVLVGAAGNHATASCSSGGPRCYAMTVCPPHDAAANVLTVGALAASAEAREASGIPDIGLRAQCNGESFMVGMLRARFSPWPLPALKRVRVRVHGGGELGCEKGSGGSGVVIVRRGECRYTEKVLGEPHADLLLVVNNLPYIDGIMDTTDNDTTSYPHSALTPLDEGGKLLGIVQRGGECYVSGPYPYHSLDSSVIISDSGKGPGRTGLSKPDVVAPGELVLLPRANTSHGLISHTGTSAATALVGGCALLLREALRKGIIPRYGRRPSYIPSSTVRGLLVHSAVRHNGTVHLDGRGKWGRLHTEAAWDEFQGHGEVHAEGALKAVVVEDYGHRSVCLRGVPGETVRVTMAWTVDAGPSGLTPLPVCRLGRVSGKFGVLQTTFVVPPHGMLFFNAYSPMLSSVIASGVTSCILPTERPVDHPRSYQQPHLFTVTFLLAAVALLLFFRFCLLSRRHRAGRVRWRRS